MPYTMVRNMRDAYFAYVGRGLNKWLNSFVPGAGRIVITDADLVFNIPRGKLVMVRRFCYGIQTVSDNCKFEIGFTNQPNGAGTFTPITHEFNVTTGASVVGRYDFGDVFRPPIRIRYRDGARSVTCRVDASDASCEISVAWHGWYEDDYF